MRPRTPTRSALWSALRAYGRNATSFQLLERDFRVWQDSAALHPRAVVAYVDTGAAWVAGGEPLAPEDAVNAVAERFLDAARESRRRAAFFATDGRLVSSPRFRRLLLGEQPVWDPTAWSDTVQQSRTLRAQLRRARAKGVAVRQVGSSEIAEGTALHRSLAALVSRWKASRAMAEMGFLVRVEPFLDADERRLFIAEHEGRVVGVLSMAPVYARRGWLFEDLLRDASAPNGTSELLVDAGMRVVADDGCTWATLGLAPLAGPVAPWLARVSRWATPFFNFRGLHAFKAKLRPHSWEPIWLAYPAGTQSWRALADALTAFANGSLGGFGLRTLVRGPRPVLLAMTALLVPWTISLAALDTTRWFAEPWMQRAWVGFDLALVLGLVLLLWKWREWLGVLLASAVSVDATVTLVQALTWYVPRATGVLDLLLIGVVVSAPMLAAVVLWGTVGRERQLRSELL